MGEYEQRCWGWQTQSSAGWFERAGECGFPVCCNAKVPQASGEHQPTGPGEEEGLCVVPFPQRKASLPGEHPMTVGVYHQAGSGQCSPSLEDQRQGLSVHFHTWEVPHGTHQDGAPDSVLTSQYCLEQAVIPYKQSVPWQVPPHRRHWQRGAEPEARAAFGAAPTCSPDPTLDSPHLQPNVKVIPWHHSLPEAHFLDTLDCSRRLSKCSSYLPLMLHCDSTSSDRHKPTTIDQLPHNFSA